MALDEKRSILVSRLGCARLGATRLGYTPTETSQSGPSGNTGPFGAWQEKTLPTTAWTTAKE